MTADVRRRIRSFVRREGRFTPAQQRALDTLWPDYGLHVDNSLQPERIFGRNAPLILEIGFGNGESLIEMASSRPDLDFIGIEVHRPGVGRLLLALEAQALKNVKVYCADAVEVLEKCIPDASLQRVNIFFPDPWHKKKHHKRRLIQPAFIQRLENKIEPGGILHIATDWPDYARHIEETLALQPAFSPMDPSNITPPRPLTKYEWRGQRLGHPITDLAYLRR
ncbi:MAG: tRNA (guanine-N7)-methyltransferase [Methylothermaceae bacteria B42]|nr:MAG: tRNA (guanine-N7)-methyltransferase [Methylothermaceae bacteria B42]HHJ38141.1 tRNA (guanosine(46)-N7)-methyltransferase TrmB [Methylothermaceae bacterium]